MHINHAQNFSIFTALFFSIMSLSLSLSLVARWSVVWFNVYIVLQCSTSTVLALAKQHRWCMWFKPSPDAPVAVMAGGAQRIAHMVKPSSPWNLVACDKSIDTLGDDVAVATKALVIR
jgi:hypothetical protein